MPATAPAPAIPAVAATSTIPADTGATSTESQPVVELRPAVGSLAALTAVLTSSTWTALLPLQIEEGGTCHPE
ncbi:hypothetical protein ABT040_40435 [Streptomyces sp. NPDC002688]|uniref:hypothetical protein n=1 Tax=Streptomyces sp. NPDC002688 TaxID=3154423 RepID=UPI00332276EB